CTTHSSNTCNVEPIMENTSPQKQALIEHSELCQTLSIRKKCGQCRKDYNRENKRHLRRMKEEKTIKTRSVTNNKGSKYSSVLCIDCKDKKQKDFCRECHLEYFKAKQKVHNRNAKKQKSILKEVTQVQSDPSKAINENFVSQIESNEQSIQVQPSTISNSMCQLVNENESYCCEQSNHTDRPDISKLPNKANKGKNTKVTKKSEVKKIKIENIHLCDLEIMDTPRKKWSEKTVRDKMIPIWKELGSSPNRRMQMMTHMLKCLPIGEAKAVLKNLLPDLEEDIWKSVQNI
ncbi:unnamed protein product, partial [Meganyctiphanes norvegica]